MKIRVLLGLIAALVSVLAIAPTASAATAKTKANALTAPVTGTVTNIGTGAVTQAAQVRIQRFEIQNGQLVAIAAVTDAAGQVLATVPIPVDLGPTQGTCRILHLELGPLDLNLLGLRIQLNRVVLDITAERGPGNLLGNLLCAIAGLLDRPPTAGGLVAQLNRLVRLIGGGPFATIPATGTVTNPATGAVTQVTGIRIARFAIQNGQLVAIAALLDAAGNVLATVPIPVDLGPTQGTCQILHLELGPLDLNLLGLRIQLNRVVLDITAEPGPGNLLGNLLCSIARLLDRNPTAGLANLLNRLIGLTGANPLASVPATGTVTNNTGAVTQVASLDVIRFVARKGRLMAIVALMDAAGNRITTAAVPVVRPASHGTCQILRLVLGPLDLNILGLRIQLSRVELVITAEPGPGNLLGNLLCRIAHLLDRPGGVPALANQLNRLVALRR